MNGKKSKKLRAVAAMLKDAGHQSNITQIYRQLKKIKTSKNGSEKKQPR